MATSLDQLQLFAVLGEESLKTEVCANDGEDVIEETSLPVAL